MLARCRNKNAENYKWYGGRGIKVCKRWEKFENFKKDMGERPKGMTLDRINVDGDYRPSNCRWISQEEQKKNTVKTKRFALNGEYKTIRDWSKQYGIKERSVCARVNKLGWTLERALTTPLRQGNYAGFK
jgi:hypothetical protein